jgi:outer membrane lipoprotein-sorting protein
MKKIFMFFIIPFVCFAQSSKSDKIIDSVKANFSRVKDYEVNVHIKVDVNFLKVPEAQATIFFKQPDKIKLKSEGFAMLPKEGLNFSPLNFLTGDYTSIFDKEGNVDGYPCYLVKVIPLGDESDLILTNMWIDKNKFIIRKIESTTKSNGTFEIDLKYRNNLKYPLPSSMVFTFNVQKMDLPKGITGDMDEMNQPEKENEKKNKSRTTTGKVYVNYSDYRVNINLPDSIFVDNKK